MNKIKKLIFFLTLSFILVPLFASAAITAEAGLIFTSDTEATITITNSEPYTPIAPSASVLIKRGTTSGSLSNPSTVQVVGPGSAKIFTISGLTPSTTYYYAVYEANGSAIIGDQQSFVTQASGQGFTITPTNLNATDCTGGADGYCLLAPLPGLTVINNTELNDYFSIIYRLLLGLAGVLAVIMIFFGGVQYMTTDALGDKEDGRKKIWNAVIGLVIALGSYAILNTINPKLLDFTFGVDKVTIQYNPPDAHTLQPLVSGKYCKDQNSGQGYSQNETWDTSNTEATQRAALASINITIQNQSICTHVGQLSCTSVSDLNLFNAATVRSKCFSCQLVLNGGTECWLHTLGTKHGKGSGTIDFDDTPSLQSFIEQDTHPVDKPGWGKLYTVHGIKFVDEGDHIHIVE